MGIMDFIRGVKRPDEDSVIITEPELRDRLLAMNDERLPFAIRPGDIGELEAEWKIVDASWYEIFGKAGLTKTHRIHLTLDEAKHEARALEESLDVEWQAGVPRLSFSAEKFQGRTLGSKSFGTGYAFTSIDPLDFGKAYSYRFDVSEMKDPIVQTILDAGWTYVPVATKRRVRAD